MKVHTFVHGTVFGDRPAVLARVAPGDRLLLVPDPPDVPPAVWVHVAGGDVLGHLPEQIAAWLAPWLLEGGRGTAVVTTVHDDRTESWRRIEVELDVR